MTEGLDTPMQAETSVFKELITVDGVAERTKQFFQGIDLNKGGITDTANGIVIVKSHASPGGTTISHEATVNGLEVAHYQHLHPDFPLVDEEDDRIKAKYALYGEIAGRGEVSITCKEWGIKPPEIRLSMPRSTAWGERSGPINEFAENVQEQAARVLGINI